MSLSTKKISSSMLPTSSDSSSLFLKLNEIESEKLNEKTLTESDEIDLEDIDDDLEQLQQDEVIKEAISKGIDLRKYAREIDQELKRVEMASVKDYANETVNVIELYKQIHSCDGILARMQELLLGFQADLGGISDEIRSLQEQSLSMNIKLKNRRNVEAKLGSFLKNLVVGEDLVQGISDGEVNDAYVEYLVELNSKVKYIKSTKVPVDGSSLGMLPKSTAAVVDMEPQLDRLRQRAIAKAREFLLTKINELKKAKTNVQMLQQNVLIKQKYLMEFLSDNSPEIALEIQNSYVDIMSKTLHTIFRAYFIHLAKLHLEMASKNDLIAVEEQSVKALFSTKVNLSKRSDAFSLGDRDKILDEIMSPPILFHVAQAESSKFPYEVIFRSLQQHLMNSVTSEYIFTIDFFPDAIRPRDLFMNIFATTLSLCLENIENYLFTCYDAIGLLLMIRITREQRLLMEKRRIPCLDAYFDRVTMLLWPRFKALFDANLNSVRKAKPKKLGNIDLHPHYVTRRYAELAASVLSLSGSVDNQGGGGGGGADEMLLNNLALLRQEIVKLLVRLAAEHKQPKAQMVFLINNYDQVLQVFQERRIRSDETTKFEDLLAEQRSNYVEEELHESYHHLIVFVKQSESTTTTSATSLDTTTTTSKLDITKIESIVLEFASTWKSGIEHINTNVMAYFSNFRNGMEILKQVLTQLLLYYTRFIEIVKKTWKNPPPFSNAIVTTHEILYEIKKYSRSF